jgi:hypothetical protein
MKVATANRPGPSLSTTRQTRRRNIAGSKTGAGKGWGTHDPNLS